MDIFSSISQVKVVKKTSRTDEDVKQDILKKCHESNSKTMMYIDPCLYPVSPAEPRLHRYSHQQPSLSPVRSLFITSVLST